MLLFYSNQEQKYYKTYTDQRPQISTESAAQLIQNCRRNRKLTNY